MSVPTEGTVGSILQPGPVEVWAKAGKVSTARIALANLEGLIIIYKSPAAKVVGCNNPPLASCEIFLNKEERVGFALLEGISYCAVFPEIPR